MTKKQHREEHCRLIKEFRQPRVTVKLKPYAYSTRVKKFSQHIDPSWYKDGNGTNFAEERNKNHTKEITKYYVTEQLEQSVLIEKQAPKTETYIQPLKELQRKNIKKEIELSKKLIRQIKEERNKPRWKFR